MQRILTVFLLLSINAYGQTVQLNEIVSSNASVLYDEDGDTPDWIELHNPSNQTVNLDGFGITDDPGDLSMWIFPSIVIEPDSFLVIFASDKNRTNLVAQWDAVINWGDSWSYWPGTSAPVSNWDDPGTDISDWSTGPSGFGYGDNDDNTNLGQIISVFARKTFQIDNPTIITKALFHIDYDDGYIAYLNGVEFSRRNMGAPNTEVYYNETTTGLHEAEIYAGGFPEEISIDLNEFPFVSGDNTLAVEVHNYNTSSSDLSCIPFLTLGYNSEIDNPTEPHQLMVLPNSYLHTNFKISSSGEDLILSDQDENVLDTIFTGMVETDMSFGRYFESGSWVLFADPTPGSSDSSSSYAGALSPIEFSMASGFYNQGQISVELSNPDESATIYFTTDGTAPTM
ncbi:MAG: lamin tail domain-containing protein, partial [Candidatus Neomarinimicrobiota bacterium]|nr:lamin tail domain-containing protein [Candidatus Neomarinimicrobiota bacterium]